MSRRRPDIPRVSGKRFVGRRVAVAYNRHECLLAHPVKPGEHCFSVRAKPTTSSKVLGYADELWLEDVEFFTSPSGLKRIQDTGRRTPIAFVVGTVMRARPASTTRKRGWFKVRFDPFEQGCFFDTRNDACLRSAKYLRLGDRHMEAFGPKAGENIASLRELNPAIPTVGPPRETWRGDMGGVNYGPATARAIERAVEGAQRRWPGCVVVDGTDDWEAPRAMRPELWPQDLGVRPTARWHTGASGVSASGLVLSAPEFQRLERAFARQYGVRLRDVPGRASTGSPSECGCWDGRGFRIYPSG